jgi:hypothetical protein
VIWVGESQGKFVTGERLFPDLFPARSEVV